MSITKTEPLREPADNNIWFRSSRWAKFAPGERLVFQPVRGMEYFWSGEVAVIMKDGTIRLVRHCYIKDADKRTKSFEIDCFEIAIPMGNSIRFTYEENLTEARKYYLIPYLEESFQDHFRYFKHINELYEEYEKQFSKTR